MDNQDVIFFSPRKFLAGCFIVSLGILAAGQAQAIPVWVVAAEVLLTVIGLFVLGSMKYQLDKNALTYGMVMVIAATFTTSWWPGSALRAAISAGDYSALTDFAHHYFLTLHGWDELVHADTMLFILGLTLFVSVIAQTRLLETVSFAVLKKSRGAVVTTVAILAAIVSLSSGILDGVSMIGLMIRTLVIILFLARAKDEAVLYAVMVSTVVTTVCGMWLAYGEPPNLIMKANLHPYLDNAFFLRYCLPVAVGSYFIVMWNVRKRLKGVKVEISELDVLDLYTADVRFLQAVRHGEVLTPVEFIDGFEGELGVRKERVEKRLHHGEPLGIAMVKEGVPAEVRRNILGKFVVEELGSALDEHYVHVESGHKEEKDASVQKIHSIIESVHHQRISSQKIGGISFIPFVGLLVWHAVDHSVPLFLASFAGFAAAFAGIFRLPKMRGLALKEAKHEYTEYLFLLPLFLSITLLQKTGFFNQLAGLLHQGMESIGTGHVAFIQFMGATFLSAILDNNVVADFASRVLYGLDVDVLHLFAMAQIAGYATGGCWTHIGCAQSVVAYAFIRKEVDPRYTPFQWIKAMTPVILEIFVLMTVVVYGEALILRYWR